MHELSCIIVEDEPLAAKLLTEYVAQVPYLSLKAVFRDATAAAQHLQTNKTDLVFLDIHLPGLKGIDFLKAWPGLRNVIITTAYPDYAVDGFNLSVTDYLLKPFSFDRFMAAVTKLQSQLPSADHCYIMVNKKKVKLVFADILYIESQREYVKIVTAGKAWVTRLGTQEMETLLPAGRFIRVHRSFIVNKEAIDAFTADEIEICGNTIPIGRAYRHLISGW